ncbi:MAG: gliding motility-associated C-terminal domain-containing protein [Bacteroidales bacterium]|nr:gliding motility-associated C-terminal domain-containing protein [Bacteroidales bacterium]
MNEYYVEKKDNIEEFKQRLREYREEPDKQVWDSIEKKLDKKKFPFKTLSIVGLFVFAGLCSVIYFAPENKADKEQTDIKKTSSEAEKYSFLSNFKNLVFKQNNGVQKQKEVVNQDLRLNNAEFLQPNADEINYVFSTDELDNAEFLQSNTEESNQFDISEMQGTEKAKLVANQQQGNINPAEREKNEAAVNAQKPADKVVPGTGSGDDNADIFIVPNAFTPLQSTNNVFLPVAIGTGVSSYEMKIFARNGSQVFLSKDINNGWDGKVKGSIGQEGVYVYVITFTDGAGKQKTQKGNVVLLK